MVNILKMNAELEIIRIENCDTITCSGDGGIVTPGETV